MTLRFPERLKMEWLIASGLLLLVLQLLTGASLVYAELIFLFTVCAGVAVNLLGGLRTLSGFCVAALALKVVLISQWSKVLFWELPEAQLENPLVTAGALAASMASICLAATASRFIGSGAPLIPASTDPAFLHLAALVTFAIGFCALLISWGLGNVEGGVRVGGVFGILRQLNFCLSLSMVCGTAHTILVSNGRRSVSWLNGIPALLMFASGFIYANKQGMFEPVALIGLTAAAFRFRVRLVHALALIGFALCAQLFLFPFAQAARAVIRGETIGDNLELLGEFMQSYFTSRSGWQDLSATHQAQQEEEVSYYQRPDAALDRLSLIKPVDVLITATLRQGKSGWETVIHGFKMLLPRKLYPQKPAIGSGNILGLKSGLLSEDDFGTQVSFSIIGDAFSSFGWRGVALIPFALCLPFFLIYQRLVGPVERNVWCIYLMVYFQHFFVELSIAGLILSTFQLPLVFLATSWLLRLSFSALRSLGWSGALSTVSIHDTGIPRAVGWKLPA